MSIVLAYHGCSKQTALSLLGGSSFAISSNKYDWLGAGAYFWEWDYARAYDWALETKGAKHASVVGAAIDLGNCLDLSTLRGSQAVEAAYQDFVSKMQKSGEAIPSNENGRKDSGDIDLGLRYLDSAVIAHLHESMKNAGIQDYDTTRALFPEGQELYPGAGFKKKTHVQIAVRNLNQILGVFRVPTNQLASARISDSIYNA